MARKARFNLLNKLMLFVCVYIGLSLYASASEVSVASIKKLMLSRAYGEIVFVDLDVRQNETISCHTNSWEFVLDVSDTLGKSLYSSLLLLYASGKQANFKGSGTCSLYNNIETLDRIDLLK